MLTDLKSIRIEDYDYPLPDARIAKYPMPQRDNSKLLLLNGKDITAHHFFQLPDLLPSNSLLVFNNTKVIHARLFFRKDTGATIEIFCLEPYNMPTALAFDQRGNCSWVCYIGNNKKWKGGELTASFLLNDESIQLTVSRRSALGDAWIVDFNWTGAYTFAEVIDALGVIPLPPYLHREADENDTERYQTVYAQHEGSVAAPTAGLHFTPQVLGNLKDKGVSMEYITLHVGAGTFKPVTSDTIGEHVMHVEPVHITADNLRHIVLHGNNPIIAVGTTSVRTLESLYWFGVQLHNNPNTTGMHIDQWMPYMQSVDNIPYTDAYQNILRWMENKGIDELHGETQLLIAPGYRYRVINGLITNFHQPKSTLLLLVSALVGERWRDCYRFALDHDFRFLSYGDSCLFLP
ncbi:MAG: S-adenosylmethionine:tRNA ribosyltransferase-isomerase [Bacteroidales bacterium]|nr:S-adenosylmethionine:tRNA ribosyltransferase-isomerase [Bacteroidales bacterium]